MDDYKLDKMSVKELRSFKDEVDAAIRAKIAQDHRERDAKLAKPSAADAPPPLIDLERERDAWQASKKTGLMG